MLISHAMRNREMYSERGKYVISNSDTMVLRDYR